MVLVVRAPRVDVPKEYLGREVFWDDTCLPKPTNEAGPSDAGPGDPSPNRLFS